MTQPQESTTHGTTPGISIHPVIGLPHDPTTAARFYQDAFPRNTEVALSDPFRAPTADSAILSQDITIAGTTLTLLNMGSKVTHSPAITFTVYFDEHEDKLASTNLRTLWDTLSDGGTVRVPLAEFPHTGLYGWVEDRFGVNWQLMLTVSPEDPRPHIVPSLLFTGPGPRAGRAIDRYLSALPGREVKVMRAGEGTMGGDATDPAHVLFSAIELGGLTMSLADGGDELEKHFGPELAAELRRGFGQGVGFMLTCETQAEVDRVWEELSANPEVEACGWLVDEFGVGWNVVPAGWMEKMREPGNFQKMLRMKKLDVRELD